MKMWRRVVCCLATVAWLGFGAMAEQASVIGRILRVTGDALDTGSGASWADAMTWTNALKCAVTSDVPHEIWVSGTTVLKANTSYSFTKRPVTIRGGFAGTEASPDERPADSVSRIDAENSITYCLNLSNGADAPVTIERIDFYRGRVRSLTRSGAGDFTLVGCRMGMRTKARNNDTNGHLYDGNYSAGRHQGGGGGSFSGSGAAVLTVSNCVFYGNTANGEYCASGCGAWVGGFARADFVDTSFTSNNWVSSRSEAYATAIQLYGQKNATFRGCDFRGNYGQGQIVHLEGNCTGAVFEHCVFAGNECSGSALLMANLNAAASTIAVTNCTFAYNYVTSGGAVVAAKGTLTVANSIFHRNLANPTCTKGVDVAVTSADASASLAYCALNGLNKDYVSSAGDEPEKVGLLTVGDPMFVTPTDAFMSKLKVTSAPYASYTPAYHRYADFDLHLKSSVGYFSNDGVERVAEGVYSPAIDKGDPDADCSLEPTPNGGRLNLGAYGGTAKASKTAVATPAVDAESFAVAYSSGYSQPTVSFTMAGEGVYSRNVVVTVLTNGVVAYASDLMSGLTNGQEVAWLVPTYFVPGSALSLSVAIEEVDTPFASEPDEVRGEMPPWHGKKGPANVVHVRAGATGKGDGSSWTDAFADFRAAVLALKADRNEIWIAGDPAIPVTSPDFAIANAFKIRGGFVGVECDAAERTPGARSVLDGGNERDPLKFTNSAEAELENLVFTHGIYYGLRKKGAGDLTVTNCAFVANGCQSWLNEAQANYHQNDVTDGGAGACFKGSTSSTKLKVVDCVFAGNLTKDNCEYVGSGLGAFCGSMKEALFDSCLFVTNNNRCYRGGHPAALSIANSRTEVRNCEFRGNNNGLSAGALYFNGSCGGSLVDHCLFAGNLAQNDGVVSFDLSSATSTVTVDHCSIAYNLAGNGTGLRIGKGMMIVRNSIIRDNPSSRSVDRGIDVWAGADGKVILSFTVCGGKTTDYLFGNVEQLDGVITLEPKFVTSVDEFVALYKVTGLPNGSGTLPSAADRLSLDLHLLSEAGYLTNGTNGWQTSEGIVSPAIDAGDYLDSVGDEPWPNGNCVNAGCYGGTKFASKTPVVEPRIEGEVLVTFGEYTQPTVTFVAGGEGSYAAKATLRLTCNGKDFWEKELQGITNGQVVAILVPAYFELTDKLNATITLKVLDSDDTASSGEVDVAGRLPPWYGRGGDPTKVIHVRTGSLGKGDGTSWTDATTWSDALTRAKEWTAPVEIWVATNLVTLTLNDSYSYTKAPVTIRGGFTATENVASERPDGLMTVVDAENSITYCLNLSNGADAPVAIERIDFYRGRVRSLTRSGAGDFTLVGCKMGMRTKARNGDSNGHLYDGNYNAGRHQGGGGGSFSGSGAAVLTVSNCVFYGNTANGEYCASGCGAWVGGFARADFVGTSFTSNNWVSSRSEAYATAIQLYGQKNATFRGCDFRGNSGQGQIVHFEGNCTGAVFDHCVFAGNSCSGNAIIGASLNSDESTLAMTNCTVAYNRATSTAVRMTKGTLSVGNSIFYGNIVNVGTTHGADIFLDTNGRAQVDYTLFGGEGTNYVSAVSNDMLAVTHAIFGNPQFATTANEFMTLFKVSAIPQSGATFPAWAKAVSLNVHLAGGAGYFDEATGELVIAFRHGRKSPAIDAGDPASDWAREPTVPRTSDGGGRINLGAYGNTPWATMTRVKGAFLSVR